MLEDIYCWNVIGSERTVMLRSGYNLWEVIIMTAGW